MRAIAVIFALIALSACAASPEAEWRRHVEIVPPSDPAYASVPLDEVKKVPGQGGVSEAQVVRLTQDLPVYRLWNGPAKVNDSGQTNRLGPWWSFDPPKGAVSSYRNDYEICLSWNDLTWAARCTLKKGTVVAIGPGQSVSVETCKNPAGPEQYGANPRDWQVYINQPWTLPASRFECPPVEADYPVDPAEIGRKLN